MNTIFRSFANFIRALFAIVSAVAILLSTTLFVLVLSPLALLQRVGVQNPVPFICGWGFRIFDLVAIRGLLGVWVRKRTSLYRIAPAGANDVLIIIANHPTLPVLFSTPSLVWDLGPRGYAAVIKAEFVRQPWLAWLGIPATLAGFALPIRRDNREEAMAALAKGVRRLPFGRRPFGVIIFPDGTRPTPSKIAASWQRFENRTENPQGYTEFKQTTVPKALGLHQLITGIKDAGHTPRIIDVTIALNRRVVDTDLLSELLGMVGGTLTVHRAEVTLELLSLSVDELQEWLIRRWAEKNRKLQEVSESSDSP